MIRLTAAYHADTQHDTSAHIQMSRASFDKRRSEVFSKSDIFPTVSLGSTHDFL